MLRSFRVGNHKSFREEQELLLLPTYAKNRPVTPVAAVFGANASGKSNLLDAVSFMQTAVRDSFARWEAGSGIPRHAFKLSSDGTTADSSFVVNLDIRGVQYVYGFAVDDERVNDEWLYSYPQRRKRVIFEREGDRVSFGSTVPEGRSLADLLRSVTRPNSLLLTAATQANIDVVAPVYQWFRTQLRVVPSSARHRLEQDVEQVADVLRRYPDFVELVRIADLGIADIQVEGASGTATEFINTYRMWQTVQRRAEMLLAELRQHEEAGTSDTADAQRLREEHASADARDDELRSAVLERQGAFQQPQLVFLHGTNQIRMALDDQSEGTVTWLNLLVHAVDALADGAVMVIDEIDASLHPRLTARLIEMFRDEQVNQHNAQLIFTTHDATLMGTSFGADILGRDEIWFVQKDAASGATSLYPLTDFRPRQEDNRVRRYLGGSYGGVPAVYSHSLVEALRGESETTDAQP